MPVDPKRADQAPGGASSEALDVLVDAGVPGEAAAEWLRVLADSLQRIAEPEARLMAHAFGNGPDAAAKLTALTGPIVENNHRELVTRAIERDRARGAEGAAFEATIVFVDVVSYTPLTDEHGDMVAIDVLRRLDGLVRARSSPNRGDLVKQIGDAFMLEFEAAPEAMRFCLALRDAVRAEGSLPSLRIGISRAGPLGDYLGQTVNIAARLCDTAGRDEILMTSDVAEAARRRGGRE